MTNTTAQKILMPSEMPAGHAYDLETGELKKLRPLPDDMKAGHSDTIRPSTFVSVADAFVKARQRAEDLQAATAEGQVLIQI